MRRFSADEIAPFSEASPLAHSCSCREVWCQKNRERLFPPIVSGLLEYFLCVHTWAWLPNARVCVCACAVRVTMPAPCGCLGAAHECVSVLAPVGEKKSSHRFEEPNQRLANVSRLLCSSEATAGLLFPQPTPLPFFFFFAPTFSYPWLLKELWGGSVLHRALCWRPSELCYWKNLLPRASGSLWINRAPAESETCCIFYFLMWVCGHKCHAARCGTNHPKAWGEAGDRREGRKR